MNEKELLERIEKLEKSLHKMARYIDAVVDACPLEILDKKLDCCDKCCGEVVKCWERWAMKNDID